MCLSVMVGFDQDHSINTLVGGISPLVSLQIASKMKQERQEHELQAPQAYLGIVSWTSRACAMALHFWLAPLSWAEQAGPPWSQATSTGRLCARNSPRVCRRCNTTFHWDAICVFRCSFLISNWPKAFILCKASRVSVSLGVLN